ncbi:MAG: tetratricopeptide repeat protein, partial [Tepidisphaeraceae bacterium]
VECASISGYATPRMTTPNQQQDPHQSEPVDLAFDGDDAAEKLVLTGPDAASTQRDFALWAGVLFLLALTVYSPAMRGEFLWDDDDHVSHNANLRSLQGLRNIWTKLGELAGGTPQYYPLTHTTYWIEYQLFGKGADAATLSPIVFHVTNTLLHAGAATLLWFILRRLRVPGAWLAAAVFAVHPVHSESVAWVSERKNVLSAVFMFASILTYLKFENIGDNEDDAVSAASSPSQRDFGGAYALSLALFVCALLSKTVAFSMPAVVLVLTWWKRGRVTVKDILPLMPFFVIGIGMALLTSYIEKEYVIGAHYAMNDWNLTAVQKLLVAGHAIWFYAFKLLMPFELTFTYPRWDVNPSDPLQWLFVIAAIAVPVALWGLRRRIGRAPLAAVLIYMGVLVPALGFFDVYPMRYSFVADHFQYHASPALIALIVGGLVLGFRRLSRKPQGVDEQSPTPYVASGVVLLVLGVLTFRQSFIYADAVTLWRDTVTKNPAAWMAHHNLGYELTDLSLQYQKIDAPEAKEFSKDLLNEAVGHLGTAVNLRPQHDMAIVHWGRALLAQGKDAEALAKFDEALKVNPQSVEAMTNRGFMLQRMKKPDEAIAAYRQALDMCESGPAQLRGRCGQIGQLLGRVLEQAKNPTEAIEAYRRAIKHAPNNNDVRYDLGILLARQGNKADQVEAADQFLAILRRDPQNLDAHISLAMLMTEVGNLDDAQRELLAAAAIDQTAPRLLAAAKLWNEAKLKQEASTQPSTTQSSTQPTTSAAGATTQQAR